MKSKRAVIILAICLLLPLVIAVPFAAQAQGPNLLKNPGFEEGHHHQDNITEITVPDGWRMHWSNREPNIFEGYAETQRPETVAWNIADAPLSEKDLFWRDGIYTVKIFKGWAPVWAAMSQDVSGLEVGRKYRLVAPVYVDIVADYAGGAKVPPQDGRQGRVRLGAGPVGAAWRDEANINYSGWWTGETISPFYFTYNTYIHEFTATATDMTVWIEVAGNYPHPNNGFFIDTVGLYALDEVNPAAVVGDGLGQSSAGNSSPAQPAGPTPLPAPSPTPRADGAVVHIVQPGDSIWSLAANYADVMGITPQEALTVIPELNNNPAVLRSGMELIIVPPSADGGQVAGEETVESSEVAAESTPESTPESEAVPADDGSADAAAESESSQGLTAGESTESPVAEILPQISPASICVQVFEDINGDGRRAEQGELPMADQAVTLSRAGNTVTTFISDGSSDLHCFDDLNADTYQVQIFPTADYLVTSDDSWAVAVADGVMIPVSFGLQKAGDEVADASAAVDNPTSDAAVAAQANPSGGLSSNMGLIILGVAGLLVLLLGAGVYLLRRG